MGSIEFSNFSSYFVFEKHILDFIHFFISFTFFDDCIWIHMWSGARALSMGFGKMQWL